MPTARSWADLRHLLWFRAQTVRRRRAAAVALAALVLVTLLAAVVPAAVQGIDRGRVVDALPGVLSALVLVTVTAAVATAGGRELLARDPASIHPISPFTDHLGSLVLAPLSAPWLIETWGLLGAAGVAARPSGPAAVVLADLVALGWICCATALGQAVAWFTEWLRRGPRGVVVARSVLGAVLGLGSLAGALPSGRSLLVAGPSYAVAEVLRPPSVTGALISLVALVVVFAALVALGGVAAGLAARRMPRDESRLETRSYPARPTPSSDAAMMRRLDRASVWRSVPLRRGIYLLALAPGLVALLHPMAWGTLTVLPGLVASGCVLLFGVNLWSLDGRGLLWRESLPVAPGAVFAARAAVLAELLAGAGVVTVVLGAVRADAPTPTDVVGVVAALLVVTGQAMSGGLRWSLRAPYAVDLRSARATPAPPLVMVGYSIRLALATTLSTVLIGGLAFAGRPDMVLVVAAVLLLWSCVRVLLVRRRWLDPGRRSRVVAVVTA